MIPIYILVWLQKTTKTTMIVISFFTEVSEQDILTGNVGSNFRKSNGLHVFIVKDESTIAGLPIEVYDEEYENTVRVGTMGELIKSARDHVR